MPIHAHASNVSVPRDFDLWPFDPKINRFSGLTVENLYVKLSDPSCIGFWDIAWKNIHINAAETLPMRLLSARVTSDGLTQW